MNNNEGKDNSRNIFINFLNWCKCFFLHYRYWLPYILVILIFCIIFCFFYCSTNKNNFDSVDMLYPRYYHTATKLDDGNIIIIGGGNKFSEIYDVKNRKFIKGPECKYNRFMHNVVKLPNGNLLIIGGHDAKNTNNEILDIELYDWKKQEFSVFTRLNKQLLCPKSVMIDKNNILVISSKISGSSQFSGLPEIIDLKSKSCRIINDFPKDFQAYFDLAIIPIKIDNKILFYLYGSAFKNSKNLLWNGDDYKELNAIDIFSEYWTKIYPIENNKIFYTKTFYKQKKIYYQMGIYNLKTKINKKIYTVKCGNEYESFMPAIITKIADSKIIIAGGKTNTPKTKKIYSKDIYLYMQDKLQKIGLLHNKSLIDFTISDIGNNQIIICGGRVSINKNEYIPINKCQILEY